MGSYIMDVSQVRRAGEWEVVSEPFAICDLCLGSGVSRLADGGDACVCRGVGRVRKISVQSYALFAILAGFRNYYDWRPIREPRGLPPDLDPPTTASAKAARRLLGPAGRTWLSLADLLAYDWDQCLTAPVSVGWSEYAQLLNNGWREYSGYAHGHQPRNASEDEARRLLASGGTSAISRCVGRWPRVNGSLTRRARDWAGWFHGYFLPALEELGEPDDVRLVISFDE